MLWKTTRCSCTFQYPCLCCPHLLCCGCSPGRWPVSCPRSRWRRPPRAQQHHVPVFLWNIGHQSGGGRDGEHLSSLDHEQPGRELGLVFLNCADHGDLPLQELPREFVGGEVIVARDVTTVQSLRYIQHYPQPLVPFWASAARLSGVHLHLPNVAGFSIAGHPRLDTVFCLALACWACTVGLGGRRGGEERRGDEMRTTTSSRNLAIAT